LEEEEGLEFLLVTNSILPKEKGWDSKKIRTLSVAPLLAEAILRHSQKQSLADMLIFSEE
jgi:phosphoribosylpyrophosphate synthetase